MNWSRKVIVLVMLAVLAVTLAGAFMTRGVMADLPFLQPRKGNWTGAYVPLGVVDQRPWQTAATLAVLAQSSEEKKLARDAERLADHEVDQAFSQSLRQASLAKPNLTGKALALQQRVTELKETIKNDEARIAAFSAGAGTKSAGAASDGNDLEIAKAQLGLDQAELADSMEDLARESGDQRVKLQQELAARQAAMKQYGDSASKGDGQTAVASAEQYKTFAQQLSTWRSLRNRKQLIAQAEQLARADVAALTADQATLKAEAAALSNKPVGESSAERIDRLRQKSAQQSIQSILNDRLGAQQQLVALYGRWGLQVELEQKIVIHLILQSLAWLAAIFILVILAGWALQLALEKFIRDPRQKQTLKAVLSLGTQLVGLLLILLIIFGVPQQMPTILGLVTAGLTVVFQDFILAFCGWFVLMGPNGVRVRDWVEIDGVGGEVVQLGLFRTWLLETGNWTAHGHPTGRKVSFLNDYAIRGKYFNFSTVGQWMWDEIKVSVPPGTDIHSLLKGIYDATVKTTEADAKMAEAEWKRVTNEEGAPQFSAMPSVNLRPARAGVDIIIRYITRAGVRVETRNHVFAMIVELMQGGSKETEKNYEPAMSSGYKFEEEFTQASGVREMPSPASAEPASPGKRQSLHEPDRDYVAPPPPPPRSYPDNASLVRVFYATDRRKIHDWSDGPQYNFERSELGKLQYGKCTISIPKIHKMGRLESPSLLKLEFRSNPQKHIVLTYTTSLEEELYFEEVRANVAKSAKKEAFVFVHGYNVSFEDAARRTGQIAFDLGFIGAPIFYSWPSNNKVADYMKDETNITWSAPHFQRFLTLLSQNSGAERIHIIAHSMGNRAVCDALKALSYDSINRVKFNHLVLAAPDIDAETFQELATLLRRLAARITLYESSNDKALFASKKIHGNARAGEPLLIIPGLDTVDASLIDTDFLGHSYFSESWPLLSDIHSLLFNDEPAAQRFGLTKIDTKDGVYYAFRQ